MRGVRQRRKNHSPKERRLYKVYDRAHTRSRVLACGVAEELKRSYDPDEIRTVLDIAAIDLMGACRGEEDAYRAWQAAIPPSTRKNPKRFTARAKVTRKKHFAGGNK
jgi:hypothetical protein